MVQNSAMWFCEDPHPTHKEKKIPQMYVFLRFSNFQHHSSLHYQEQNCHIVYETLRFIHKLCQIFGYGNFMCQCINFMFWHMEYYKTNLCCLRYMMLAGGCVFFGCCSITSTYPPFQLQEFQTDVVRCRFDITFGRSKFWFCAVSSKYLSEYWILFFQGFIMRQKKMDW